MDATVKTVTQVGTAIPAGWLTIASAAATWTARWQAEMVPKGWPQRNFTPNKIRKLVTGELNKEKTKLKKKPKFAAYDPKTGKGDYIEVQLGVSANPNSKLYFFSPDAFDRLMLDLDPDAGYTRERKGDLTPEQLAEIAKKMEDAAFIRQQQAEAARMDREVFPDRIVPEEEMHFEEPANAQTAEFETVTSAAELEQVVEQSGAEEEDENGSEVKDRYWVIEFSPEDEPILWEAFDSYEAAAAYAKKTVDKDAPRADIEKSTTEYDQPVFGNAIAQFHWKPDVTVADLSSKVMEAVRDQLNLEMSVRAAFDSADFDADIMRTYLVDTLGIDPDETDLSSVDKMKSAASSVFESRAEDIVRAVADETGLRSGEYAHELTRAAFDKARAELALQSKPAKKARKKKTAVDQYMEEKTEKRGRGRPKKTEEEKEESEIPITLSTTDLSWLDKYAVAASNGVLEFSDERGRKLNVTNAVAAAAAALALDPEDDRALLREQKKTIRRALERMGVTLKGLPDFDEE